MDAFTPAQLRHYISLAIKFNMSSHVAVEALCKLNDVGSEDDRKYVTMMCDRMIAAKRQVMESLMAQEGADEDVDKTVVFAALCETFLLEVKEIERMQQVFLNPPKITGTP